MAEEKVKAYLEGKAVCREFYYRRNIKTPGRTQAVVVDARTWSLVKPTKTERSRTGAHGTDVYCVDDWNDMLVIQLNQSTSGKLSYVVDYRDPAVAKELKDLLAMAEDFEEALTIIRSYVLMKGYVRKMVGGSYG